MNKTKLISVLLLIGLLLSLCACKKETADENKDEIRKASKNEMYELGLDLVSVLDEMVKSEDYASIMSTGALDEVISQVNTDGYDKPSHVYSLKLPSSDELLGMANLDNNENWNALSDTLKDQLKNRLNFSVFITSVNNARGSKIVAFSSAYIATDYCEDKKLQDIVYLYFFEDGTPIAVTFNKRGNISAQFLFAENIENIEKAKDFFKELNAEIEEIKIK